MSGYGGEARSRWTAAGVSLVAGMLVVLLGADPATAAPAVGRIVALETAADAEVDSLEARADNFEKVEQAVDDEEQVTAEDLTAQAWEPVPGPSEAPEQVLPEASSPPVADAPGGEGATEPTEDVPAETAGLSASTVQSFAEPSDAGESEPTTVDLADGSQEVEREETAIE